MPSGDAGATWAGQHTSPLSAGMETTMLGYGLATADAVQKMEAKGFRRCTEAEARKAASSGATFASVFVGRWECPRPGSATAGWYDVYSTEEWPRSLADYGYQPKARGAKTLVEYLNRLEPGQFENSHYWFVQATA